MTFFLIISLSIIIILIGKLQLGKWFNHITIYCVIWSGLILLYGWKLLPYIDIIPIAWFYIILAFLSFLFGTLTITSAKYLYSESNLCLKKIDAIIPIFIDEGKTLKYTLFFFSVICLYAGIQNWVILLHKFGSIPSVFLNANKIYVLNTKGGIKGVVPFISNFGFVAIFFSGLYTAYKGKFSLLTFFPFIGVIIKELAVVGRAGMLLALMEFLITFFLFRNLLKNDKGQRFKFSKRNAIIASTILIAFFIVSASFVRISRGSFENYTGASRALNQFKGNLIISPSLYLYLSSHLGVLSKYSGSEGEDTKFGENTFLTVYHVLNKFDVLKRDSDYQKGYFIPMWTNTGTYIRELHADFGILGILLGPYLLGLLITWLWFKFYEKKSLIVLTFLVYLYLIVGFSFLVMITRTSYWSISQLLIIICIPILEKVAGFVSKKSLIIVNRRT
jgi:oligosaccharide repeat unit polymerase